MKYPLSTHPNSDTSDRLMALSAKNLLTRVSSQSWSSRSSTPPGSVMSAPEEELNTGSPVFRPHRLRRGLLEDRPHRRRQQRLGALRRAREEVPHEVRPAALPRGPAKTVAIAALRPWSAWEVTSSTPESPRATSPRRNASHIERNGQS